MIEIRNKNTGHIIKTIEADTLRNADLSAADLRDANLRNADLRRTILPSTDAVMLCRWGICHIQRECIRIGCRYHTVTEWLSFSDEDISEMDVYALGWWKENKEIVLYIASKLEPYGDEK